jgi:phosphatidylserine/phosphatidylglycerophosphate/cardiolipin synthase-like enzyme
MNSLHYRRIKSLWFLNILFLVLTHPIIAQNNTSLKKQKNKQQSVELDVPADFGKTHFIIGYTSDQAVDEIKKNEIISSSDALFDLVNDGVIKQVFFAPDHKVQDVLLHLIENEKKSIKLAAFSFTDLDIANALIAALKRGVSIEIVADPGCLQDKFGKIPMMQDHGFAIFIYDPNHKKNNKSFLVSIMHHKFIIFGKNILDKSLLWTGSFNFTKSAHRHNQENVLVLEDAKLLKKYEAQFELLKARSAKPKKMSTPKKQTVALRKKMRKSFSVDRIAIQA